MGTPGPAPTITLDDTRAAFQQLDDPGAPLTAPEVAESLGCTRRTAYSKLEALVELGEVDTKKTGARGRVWWRPVATRSVESPQQRRPEQPQFEAFVRAVVDYAIFTLDPDGRIVSWNAGAERIKGYDEAEIFGQHVSRFYTESDIAAGIPDRNLTNAAANGRTEDEGWRVRKDGSRFWANVVLTAIHDDDGELRGFTKVTRDMTERRTRERRLEAVFNQTFQLTGILNPDGTLVKANDTALAFGELERDDVLGEPFWETPWWTLSDETKQQLRDAIDRAAQGEFVRYTVDIQGANRVATIDFSIRPVTDDRGDVEFLIPEGRDITQLKAQAQRLERRRDDLEAELEEVFERVADGFYALDDDWRFTYVNDRAEEILERPEAELLGKPLWSAFPAATEGPVWDRFHEARETDEPVSFELFYEPLDIWVEVSAYPSESGLSVYFRDVTERKDQERALERQRERYQRLLESAPVAIAIFDAAGRLQYVNEAGVDLVGGAGPGDLAGASAEELVHPGDRADATAGLKRVIEEREPTPSTELRVGHPDGRADGFSYAMVNSAPITYEGEPAAQTVLADISGQKRRERQLSRQREQLAALNQLNGVVQEITHAVIESSSRDDIETLVCERLAASDSYRYAWVGTLDRETDGLQVRTVAGVEDTDLSLGIDDGPTRQGPTATAAQTGEIHIAQRLQQQSDDEALQEHARQRSIRSMAAIPIEFEQAIYGVLTICSERPIAFEPDESDVIVQLGQVVGHAISAVDRKRALVSEEVVELRFRVRDLLADAGRTSPIKGRIELDRMLSIDAETFLAYGTATEDAAGTLDSLVEQLPYFEEVKYLAADTAETRFQLTLSTPPAVTEIAAYGGRIESVRIENGDFELVVQVPSATDIRELVQVVRDGYSHAEVVAQRRRTRTEPSISSLGPTTRATLTERQRAVLEAAYHAGFFEWPRASNGEEIADSLEIAPSTFHQHVRMSERKLMQVLFGETATAP